MDNTEDIKVLSLCTGYGGLDIALARVLQGFLRVVAVEIECYALANLVAKAEQGKLAIEALWPDMRTFKAERFRGCFDWVIAGFPCQPFSVAGKQAGGFDSRHLWPDICRIIKSVRPLRVCLENVPGLVSARILDNRPDLVEYLTALAEEERKASARDRWYIQQHRERLTAKWLREEGVAALAGVYFSLHEMGYSTEAGLFTASEIGAPHRRQRLFIVSESVSDGRRGILRKTGQGQNRAQQWSNIDRQSVGAGGKRAPQLDDTNSRRCGPKEEICTGRNRTIDAGGIVVNPIGEPGRLHATGRDIDTEARSASEAGLPHSCGKGQQKPVPMGLEETRARPVGHWPAGPGPQYEWEPPRTVKPGLGGKADGPKNRVDRLRLLGNGVVPEEAELAIEILLEQIQ